MVQKYLFILNANFGKFPTVSCWRLLCHRDRHQPQARSRRSAAAPNHCCTGKSFSEALILASTNPQYDDKLFSEF